MSNDVDRVRDAVVYRWGLAGKYENSYGWNTSACTHVVCTRQCTGHEKGADRCFQYSRNVFEKVNPLWP